MNAAAALLGCLVIACSSNAPVGDPDATMTPDATNPDAPVGCTTEPSVARTDLVQASVSYLRSAFAVADGFDGGEVDYGEMWVSLGDGGCPFADWTALGYFAPIDSSLVPAELQHDVTHVAVLWSLGGKKFVVYLTSVGGVTDVWQAGRLPDSISTVANAGASPAAIHTLVSQLQAAHPELTITWLATVRILTIDGAVGDFAVDSPPATFNTVPQIEAAAAQVRASGLFGAIEWSGLVFSIPNEQRAMHVVDTAVLRPECLRQDSRPLLDSGQLTTSPSLAAPLGPGTVAHDPVCP